MGESLPLSVRVDRDSPALREREDWELRATTAERQREGWHERANEAERPVAETREQLACTQKRPISAPKRRFRT